jgi:hypothetical protein
MPKTVVRICAWLLVVFVISFDLSGCFIIQAHRDSLNERQARKNERLKAEELQRTIHVELLAKGDSREVALSKLAKNTPDAQTAIMFPGNVDTGYFLISYEGFVPDFPVKSYGVYVTLVFQDGQYISYRNATLADTELTLFNDLVDGLYKNGKLSFSDSVKLKSDEWFSIKEVSPSAYDNELLLFQIWQAQRVDRKESSIQEYQYLITRKYRELQESAQQIRASNELAEERREQIELQRQSVAMQRNALISQALMNTFRASYSPTIPSTITCNSSGYGVYVTTTCR